MSSGHTIQYSQSALQNAVQAIPTQETIVSRFADNIEGQTQRVRALENQVQAITDRLFGNQLAEAQRASKEDAGGGHVAVMSASFERHIEAVTALESALKRLLSGLS